jgi:aryl-alcohol dehydrogenase-like predicted oxidoreductase
LKKKAFFWRSRIQRQPETSRPFVAALEEIALNYVATAAQVALNWLIWFNGELVVTIPGATQTKQAAENAGAMRFKLSEAELARAFR